MEEKATQRPEGIKMEEKKRIYYWDNVRGFLILLVVFGHILEQLPGGESGVIYKFIYLFHMPLFVFCSGYWGNGSPKKIMKKLFLPYLLLQALCCVLRSEEVQVTRPFWALWYLLALSVWRMTVPFLEADSDSFKARLRVLIGAFVCGCIAGADDTIGYYGTLSRIVVFYPYFIMGYYAKKSCYILREGGVAQKNGDGLKITVIFLMILVTGIFCFLAPGIDAKWLYGAYSYESGNYNVFFRAVQYPAAMIIGCFVLLVMPKGRTAFSRVGRDSFTIYLTHMGAVSVIGRRLSSLNMNKLSCCLSCLAVSIAFCMIVAYGKSMLRARFLKSAERYFPSIRQSA